MVREFLVGEKERLTINEKWPWSCISELMLGYVGFTRYSDRV